MDCRVTKRHGSCGVGFGATIEREEKLYSLLAGDLLYPSVFWTKFKLIKEWYGFPTNPQNFTNQIQSSYETTFELAVSQLLKEPKIKIGGYPADTIIYEGSQGLMLDKNIGFFPHVTRSNTGTTNLRQLGVCADIYLVTRCYQTRHGNGPMTNEDILDNIIRDPNETNIPHQYQGDFRISLLDIELIKYAISRDVGIKKFKLAITCLEHLDGPMQFTYDGGKKTMILNTDDEIRNVMKRETGAEEVLLFRNHKVVK
jgi:adenylosuccinate synthase